MKLRAWIALPFALMSFLAEAGGEWLAQKLMDLTDWIAGGNEID